MFKRSFDLTFSCFSLLILLPLFFLIGVLIKIDTKGPILFLHERVGIKGKIFKIYKFRTMYFNSTNKSSLTVGDDERITRFGRFLRKYKLDELPQLMNVLKGDMSIVGPRPEVLDFVNRYPLESRNIILSIRPGITDEASIAMINENEVLKNYDNPQEAYIDLIIPFKINHYLEYVEKRSFFRDCKIIVKTLLKILF